MNKIENRILENQKTIMYALSVMALNEGNFGLDTRLQYEIKETNKLLESEGRSF